MQMADLEHLALAEIWTKKPRDQIGMMVADSSADLAPFRRLF